jgi:hexosaminidase
MRSSTLSFAAVATAIAVIACVGVMADVTTLWPLPSSVNSGTSTLLVSPSGVTFSMSGSSSCQSESSPAGQFLAPAFTRYEAYIAWYGVAVATGAHAEDDSTVVPGSNVSSVIVCVTTPDLSLTLETDDSYTISLPVSGQITLSASTVFGALRALETFSQLVEYDETRGAYTVTSAPITIEDTPRFQWRGFMIDTARLFLPL